MIFFQLIPLFMCFGNIEILVICCLQWRHYNFKIVEDFGHHFSFEPTRARECKVSHFIHKMNNFVKIKPLTALQLIISANNLECYFPPQIYELHVSHMFLSIQQFHISFARILYPKLSWVCSPPKFPIIRTSVFYVNQNPLVGIALLVFPHPVSLASVLTANLTYGLFMGLIEQGIYS